MVSPYVQLEDPHLATKWSNICARWRWKCANATLLRESNFTGVICRCASDCWAYSDRLLVVLVPPGWVYPQGIQSSKTWPIDQSGTHYSAPQLNLDEEYSGDLQCAWQCLNGFPRGATARAAAALGRDDIHGGTGDGYLVDLCPTEYAACRAAPPVGSTPACAPILSTALAEETPFYLGADNSAEGGMSPEGAVCTIKKSNRRLFVVAT